MCIIIHREKGNVPNAILESNRHRNPDGFGIAWRENGSLKWQKFAPSEHGPFHQLLKNLDRDGTTEYVAHYRLATHGAPSAELSHPFEYEDEAEGTVLVFHNGIIPIQTPAGESDTRYFVNRILTNMPSGWWRNPALVYLVESSIGGSRLLVMTARETVRLNQRMWTGQSGITYSTTPMPTYYKYTPSKGSESKPSKDTTPKYLPSKGSTSYFPPKEWLLPVDSEDDVDGDSCYVDAGTPETDDENVVGWWHEGHWVESLTEFDPNAGEDIGGEVECSECGTVGEFYIISGTTFIDLPHQFTDDDEDEDALSPTDKETMKNVYAL